MKKKIVSTFVISTALFAASLFAASSAFAQNYGTSSTPNDLNVNKKVRSPLPPFNFVENLNETDLNYAPGQEVVFQLEITNSGNVIFEEVNVKDTLPANIVDARVAPELKGSFSKPILFFSLKDLHEGETRIVQVTAKIADNAKLTPDDKSLICETNYVEVTSEGRKDDDSARYCIRKDVKPVTTLPKAGVEDYLPMLPFMLLGAIGIALFIRPQLILKRV